RSSVGSASTSALAGPWRPVVWRASPQPRSGCVSSEPSSRPASRGSLRPQELPETNRGEGHERSDGQVMSEAGGEGDAGELRREIRSWVDDNGDDRQTVLQWWRRLADSGWGFPTWPREMFGRGLSSEAAAVDYDE